MNRRNINQMFDDVFYKVCNPQFGKNLGGELPLYIQTYPIQQQEEVDKQLEYLESRLEKKGMPVIFIDAYRDICLRILKDILDDIMEMEAEHSSDPIDLYDNIAYQMEPDEVKNIVEEKAADNPDAKTIFIVGIDRAFPMLRAHVILSNMQQMASSHNIILFYPGSYNNQHMSLFDRLPQENYYRAYNLDDIK
jgi:hypothetical protein